MGIARAARSRSLDDESAAAPAPAPLLSVIIPARNEQRNIERCLRSILATTYAPLEVIVVDDHSEDDTGAIARAVAGEDRRVRVIDSPALPDEWFGKQWACHTGAAAARGQLLCFCDADTTHSRDLLSRAVNALVSREADMLSVAGHQEMHSFWERVIQPSMFSMLLLRYGGSEVVNSAHRAEDVIANGQFILVRREAYLASGGHAAVRELVAEDLALAQRFFRLGLRVRLVLGMHQLSTHMYSSLREAVRGWSKNVYAGGRHAMIGGAAWRLLFPVALLAPPIMGLLPPLALALGLAGVLSSAWTIWGAICVAAVLVWFVLLYAGLEQPVVYAPLFPLGAALLLYIVAVALRRGSEVEWKGRRQRAA